MEEYFANVRIIQNFSKKLACLNGFIRVEIEALSKCTDEEF